MGLLLYVLPLGQSVTGTWPHTLEDGNDN